MTGQWHRRRGLSNLILTLLESRGEMTGAQIMREIERVTQGIWRPSPGAVYPALDKMESEGLIAVTRNEKSQRYYAITERGRRLLSPQGSLEVALGDLEYNVRYLLDNRDLLTPDLKERLVKILEEMEAILK
ncbi:PadR family transcriptional regulator [Metallosphaera javensis (ex Sakai et al. 2022)]|uniref:PadR family transcriptional regulator n=1 Tax=Metallosphaera javensis (ex Sakai et al. 2022) TaxID=2775498 RepID=UPI0025911232|nr:MAG: uncharacterized transcriptional regulator SSO0049, PadR family [Metallosphaera javensis (ex Sakai et al. 2022)]